MKTKRIIVLAMALLMILSAFAPTLGVFAEELNKTDRSNNTFHYVSIGDSMASGYGFDGYYQGNGFNIIENNDDAYGAGAYPLQFEEYLKGIYGADKVDHIKLAASALRAEDLLYLLGGRDTPADDWFNEVNYYTGVSDNEALSAFYQNAVKEADVITLGVGNASFGAFMLSRITSALGVMGGSLSAEQIEAYTLENALALLENEDDKAKVLELYNKFQGLLFSYVSAEIATAYKLDLVCNIFAYVTANFILNFAKSVDKIVELNEKENLEVILIGLMNTTYGTVITVDENTSIPFGDIMDKMFGALNAYISAYVSAKQLAGEYEGVKFLYAEQTNPAFIVNALDDLAYNNWENVDNGRLSADIIRSRIIRTYNETLRPLISSGFVSGINAAIETNIKHAVLNAYRDAFGIPAGTMNDDDFIQLLKEYGYYEHYLTTVEENMIGRILTDYYGFLPNITLDDVKAYEANVPTSWNNQYFFMEPADVKNLAVAIYLGIEDAIVKSVAVEDIPLSGLMTIAGDITSLFDGFTPSTESPIAVRNDLSAFFSSETMLPLVKIYAIFNIGDGMCVHPTPSCHDDICASIVEAYENNWTAQQQTLKNVLDFINEYGDEIYEALYKDLDENGYIDMAVDGIDSAIEYLILMIEEVEYNTSLEIPEELRCSILDELNMMIVTLHEIRDILVTDSASNVEGLIESLKELEDDLMLHAINLYSIYLQIEHLSTGHTYSEYMYNYDATCTSNGTETGVCEVCGATDTREALGTAHGHSFTNYVFNNDATCTENGTKTAKCDHCGMTSTLEAIDSATGHHFENGKCSDCGVSDPTYTEDNSQGDNEGNKNESPAEQNIFVRIWHWILNFFRKLISFFKK